MKILFICRGNVGRSQIAEAVFDKITEGKHEVTSAGTWVYDKAGISKDGQLLKDLPGAEKIIVTLSNIGINVSENKRTQLTPEMLSDADKVVVMAESHTIPDYLKNRKDAIYWEVEDPKEMNQEETNKIRNQIENLVREFASTL
jgi:protein-tyrosine-phosphatase